MGWKKGKVEEGLERSCGSQAIQHSSSSTRSCRSSNAALPSQPHFPHCPVCQSGARNVCGVPADDELMRTIGGFDGDGREREKQSGHRFGGEDLERHQKSLTPFFFFFSPGLRAPEQQNEKGTAFPTRNSRGSGERRCPRRVAVPLPAVVRPRPPNNTGSLFARAPPICPSICSPSLPIPRSKDPSSFCFGSAPSFTRVGVRIFPP